MPSWGSQTKYGDFEIVGAREGKPHLLGRGSFGKTFEAVRVDTVAGQDIREYVAIKVLDPALLTSAANRFQFIQELVALTKFKHSNLIHYIRCGEENGEVYYAMELCRGGDLNRLVRRFGPLPEKIVALIALQVAAGLREVHQRHRLVHRDLKPSNIMLVDKLDRDLGLRHLGFRFEEQDSLCRIVDFGLVDFTMNAQEARQRFVGSPMYASPEQIAEQPVDRRSDIYSLGMTLWYLLQGKGPLLEASGEELKDMQEAMRRHTLVEEHDKDLPRQLTPAFRAILAKMVAKRPEQRFGNAADLQTALREYLSSPGVQEPEAAPFSVTQLDQPLDAAFVLEAAIPSRLAHRAYVALEKSSGMRVKLNAVADLRRNDRATVDALTQYLCGLAELSREPALPEAVLPVDEVIQASDTLACTEKMAPHVALADVLRARSTAKRSVGFAEAVCFLRPIAEALDFMLAHGRGAVFLPCEEVWLTSSAVAAAPQDARLLVQPLTEWPDFQVHFSMMCVPVAPLAEADGVDSGETVSGSLQLSGKDLHPVPVFARLVYRTLNGSEVATAAQFAPRAYIPAVTLGHASNNLLRDLLCQQKPWTTVTAVIKELCVKEGVPWRPSAGRPAASPAERSDVGPLEDDPELIPAQQGSSEAVSGREARPAERAVVDDFAERATGSSVASPGSSVPGGSERGSSVPGSGGFQAPGSTGGSSRAGDHRSGISAAPSEKEKICEIVRPGVVRSPYDAEGPEQEVAAAQWVAGGRVRCRVSGKYYRLPRKLDLLMAKVVAPGSIQSPYAAPGAVQTIPWESWAPGGEVLCAESGRRITLPLELPHPEAGLIPGVTGAVLTPYDRRTRVSVAPAQWEPNAEVVCPVTQRTFVLPAALPPLEALAEADQPGRVGTPYAPETFWQIPPPEWTVGGEVACPVSGKPLALPAAVGQWAAQAEVADSARRLVSNPYLPGKTVPVAPSAWISGGLIACPESRRAIRLPPDLPPLTGELVEQRPGVVRSPYSGEIVQVALEEWAPGGSVICPKTKTPFSLPATLPEWIPFGMVAGLPAGKVKSPFPPCEEIDVDPAQWLPGQILICPKTERRFALPEDLPLFAGTVKEGEPGRVKSPYAPEWQAVSLDEWLPGREVACLVTKRRFALPAQLEEWLVDGEWAPGLPGVIRSPFEAHPDLEVPAGQWKAGGLVTCPATGRRFRIPADPLLPSLELEKAALEYARADPDATESAAAVALQRRYPTVSPAQVLAIWKRHELGTVEERTRGEQTGEAVPEAPGFVRSPYGSRPRVEVPPARWVEPGGTALCPETGRRFKLPGDLPPLLARLVENQPGMVSSPFAPTKAFQLSPEVWIGGQLIRCPETAHPLRLPTPLPAWKPVGTLKEGQTGVTFSPFGRRRAMNVRGADWAAGASVACLETGYKFALPANLPPMVGTVVEGPPGRALSPYSKTAITEIPRARWTPGAQATCPETRRVFVLPGTLPIWPAKPFPWKLVGAAAAVVLVLAGLWQLFSGPSEHGKTTGGNGGEAGKVLPPPPASVTPAPVGNNPASVATLDGGLKIADWKEERLPAGLRWSWEGKAGGAPKAERNFDGSFNLSMELPEGARDGSECVVAFSLPGWEPLRCIFKRGDQGNFTLMQRQTMKREMVALSLQSPGNRHDYEFITAKWKDHLPDEPSALPPDQNSVRQRVAAQTEEIPTGIYDLILEAGNAEGGKTRTLVWKKDFEVRKNLPALALPRAMAGEYWGMVSHTADFGVFFVVKIGEDLTSVETERVAIARNLPVFTPEEGRPYVGDFWKVSANLERSGGLRFSCPIFCVKTDWTFIIDSGGNAFLKPAISPENNNIRTLHDTLEIHLKEAVDEVRAAGQDAGEKIYDLSDLHEAIATGLITRLHRYPEFTADRDMNVEDKLYTDINAWKRHIQAMDPSIPGFRMYPVGPLAKQELPDRDWDVKPAK